MRKGLCVRVRVCEGCARAGAVRQRKGETGPRLNSCRGMKGEGTETRPYQPSSLHSSTSRSSHLAHRPVHLVIIPVRHVHLSPVASREAPAGEKRAQKVGEGVVMRGPRCFRVRLPSQCLLGLFKGPARSRGGDRTTQSRCAGDCRARRWPGRRRRWTAAGRRLASGPLEPAR